MRSHGGCSFPHLSPSFPQSTEPAWERDTALMSTYPGFLSPSSPPSSHLHFAMASVAVPTNLSHIPAPDTANPQELSRPSPAGQPNFDSLVLFSPLGPLLPADASQVNPPVSSHLDEARPADGSANHRSSSPNQPSQTIQSILAASNDPSEASSSSQQPHWNSRNPMGHPPRDHHGALPGSSAVGQVSSRLSPERFASN